MDLQHLHSIEGLQFMPVTLHKKPIVSKWTTLETKHDLSNCSGVGLICGRLSSGVEVVDVDCKYDLTGKLWDSYQRGITQVMPNLLEKLVIQKTQGNGYHLIYRWKGVAGNLKLANRPTTEMERIETYKLSYEEYFKDSKIKVKTEEGAIAVATKAKENDKVRVLLETRGEGGYIMTFPSKGYELIQRDYYGIVEISEEERNVLHTTARQFNQIVEELQVPKTQQLKFKSKGKSAFEDYNERCDVVQLLTSHGWKFVKNKGNKIHFQRPGQTSAETSGNFDTSNGWFSVFTTSTEFEPNHGYRPYAVYAYLNCNKDFTEAYKRLLDEGFGDKDEPMPKEKPPSTRIIQSRVNPDDNDLSFLATPEDYEDYLQQVIDGTLQMGLTTGSPALDEFFLFKEGNLVSVNGFDNVGKTKAISFLLMLSAMYHKWEWLIFSSENTTGSFMRFMIQLYWGRPLRGCNSINTQEFLEAKTFVEKHFTLIKAQEELYNYKDLINMAKKSRKVNSKLKGALIDPYNSLKIDLSGFSKLNTHEYHLEALSEMKAFGQQNKFGWFINFHAVTGAARQKDENKYPIAPQKQDTDGGQRTPNKSDDFITIHRITQHPTDWNVTEFHIRKIKETETGGRVSPIDNPVRFRMLKNSCGFEEVLLEGGQPVNPIARWHQTRTARTEEEKHWADRKDYQTFEQYKEQQIPKYETTIISTIPAKEIKGHKDYVPTEEEKELLKYLENKDEQF